MLPKNPYIGPRTFQRDEGHLFFGREREARDLIALVTTERLVVFHAQSGAGKSSIVNTRLIPALEEQEYEVLPVGRVSGDSAVGLQVDNLYVYNLIRSIEQHETDPAILAHLSLSEFLAHLNFEEEGFFYDPAPVEAIPESDLSTLGRRALIIDQFEELFSTHPEAWEKREDFFKQLAQAMQDDPLLWVVLVMREDYIAALDPYAHLTLNGLRVRYYMQRLEREAALEAVKSPVQEIRPYAPGVAEKLINDLGGITVQKPDGKLDMQPGQYVEPVQLQVVCYGLWDNLSWENLPVAGSPQITAKDLEDVGDVDQALGKYYDRRVAEVAAKKGVRERLIREWIEKKLIAPGGIRNMVLQETEKKRGEIDDEVIQALQSDLVRAEKRGGATWYELTHDRLVDPIQESNRDWFEKNLSPLQRQAELWRSQGRNEGWLLIGEALQGVKDWEKEHQDELTRTEREFLVACQKFQDQIEERQKNERNQLEMANNLADERARSVRRGWIFNIISGVLLVVALITTAGSIRASRVAAANARLAESEAEKSQKTLAQLEEVSMSRLSEQLSFTAQDKASSDLELAILLGLEADSIQRSPQTEETLLTLMQKSSRYDGTIEFEQDILGLQYSPDSQRFALLDQNGITLWDSETLERLSAETLNGHHGPVTAMALSNDGQLIVSGAADGTIVIWDAQKRQMIGGPLDAHQGWVRALDFSPDGRILASQSQDESAIVLWDVSDPANPRAHGKLPQSEIESVIICIAFHPVDNILASGDSAGKIAIWDVDKQALIGKPLNAHEEAVFGLAFTPDGKTLASGSYDDTVVLWDVNNLEKPEPIGQPLVGHTVDIETLTISPDGKTVASGDDAGDIFLWDVQTGEAKGPLNGYQNWVISLAFSPDSKTLAAGYYVEGKITLWDMETQTQLGTTLDAHKGSVWGLAFSPGGTTLISASEDNAIKLWDISSTESPQLVSAPLRGHPGRADGMNFSADGSLLESYGADGLVLFDVETEKLLGYGIPIDVNPDGNFVAYELGREDESGTSVLIRDTSTGKEVDISIPGSNPHVSPDGKTLFYETTDPETGQLYINVWDVAEETVIDILEGTYVSFNAAKNVLTYHTSNAQGELLLILWDTERSVEIKSIPLINLTSGPFASQDGTLLVYSSVNADGKSPAIHVLDTASGHENVLQEGIRTGFIDRLSRNGRVLLYSRQTGEQPVMEAIDTKTGDIIGGSTTGYVNGSLESGPFMAYGIYDDRAGRNTIKLINTINELELLSREGAALAMSKDGKIFVYQDQDGIQLFDLVNNSPIGDPIKGTYLGISPDSQKMITQSDARTISFWNLTKTWPLGEPLEAKTTPISNAALSPDGTKLARIGPDGLVILDAVNGEMLGGPYRDHFVDLTGTSPVFSQDGKLLALESEHTLTTTLWDVDTQEQIGELPGNRPMFSPDGAVIAIGLVQPYTTTIWDVYTQEQMSEFPGSYPLFSPDGSMLVTRNDSTNTTTIWDWRTEEQVVQVPGFSVAFSKDFSRVAVGNSSSGTTTIWNVNPWRQETAFEGSLPAFAENGNVLAIGNELTGTTRVWDIDSRTYSFELSGSNPVFSPNGSRLATVDQAAGNTMVWNASTWKPEGEFPGFIPVFGRNENVLAIGDYQTGETSIWDLRTRDFQTGYPGFIPAFGADDTVLAVGDLNTNITTTWDLKNNASIKWLATGTSAVFSRNGEILASQSSDGIVLRDLDANQVLARLESQGFTGSSVMAFYADDSKFAAVSFNENSIANLITWDIASGDSTISENARRQFAKSPEFNPVFSPDGNYLIYSGERSLEVWDVAKDELYRVAGSLEIPNVWNDISFSPDGKIMALAVGNKLSLYNFPRLTNLGGEFPTDGVISDLGFVMEDANLKYLITFYASGDTQIWDWANRTKIGDPMSGNLRFVGSNTDDRSVIYIDPSDRLIRFKWGQNQQSWKKLLCPLAKRNFTKAEWDFYFQGQNPPSANELTCVQYPGWQEAAKKP